MHLDNTNFIAVESQQCSSKLIFEETLFFQSYPWENECCTLLQNAPGHFAIVNPDLSSKRISLYYKCTKTYQTNLQNVMRGLGLSAPVSTVLDDDDQAITWAGRMINDICPALKINERQNKRSSLMSLDSCRILSVSVLV